MPENTTLRIALLSEVFCRNMGYLENALPKYFARLGAEVHVLATDLPPDYRQGSAANTYNEFLKPFELGTVQALDGFILHVLGHKRVFGHMKMTGLHQKLSLLRPDIVQTMTPIGWIALDAARFQTSLGYLLFTGCHHHASVFPLATQPAPFWSASRLRCFATRAIPGRFASLLTERCYAITPDCAEVAARFFGVPPRKIEISPLGVDTECFHPFRGERDAAERTALRSRLGFADSDIVCIYTGRFTEDKNPLLLAKAVAHLRQIGHPYRGLFVGNGPQGSEIQKCFGCTLHPFEPIAALGAFFRAADIGVWPALESLSMLDAAACGLPIVVNHTLAAPERIAGNGVTYRLGDGNDLVRALLELQEPSRRVAMGCLGAEKMALDFSWETIARRRLRDYEAALQQCKTAPERSPARSFPEQTS